MTPAIGEQGEDSVNAVAETQAPRPTEVSRPARQNGCQLVFAILGAELISW
ncbi:MAG: hypothetical protein AAFN09_06375 [Pseudomonadota bacterium]